MTAYATSTELSTFTGVSAPVDATRLLLRASSLIDDYIRTAVYPVDVDNFPTATDDIAALRDATCAQVEYWAASDEEDDVLGPVQGINLGDMALQYGAGDNRVTPLDLAPRAARILRIAHLYSGQPVRL